MCKVIELCDTHLFTCWCTQEDVDILLERMLAPEVKTTKDILTIQPILREVNGVRHFMEGSYLQVVRAKQTVRKTKTLSKRSLRTSIVSYFQFIDALSVLVGDHLWDIPFLQDGHIDVDNFTELHIQCLLYNTLK